MQSIAFPVSFKFNIGTFANDFEATDANGVTIAYVRQKMFKLKEKVEVFTDTTRTNLMCQINADKWIDFSASYSFKTADEIELGKIARKGWRSIWKASYELFDQNQNHQFHIEEENAWVKVADGLLGEIPILNFFTGYLFNPKYIVKTLDGKICYRISKEASFFGRKFKVDKFEDNDNDDDLRVMLGLMMMVLLERRRG